MTVMEKIDTIHPPIDAGRERQMTIFGFDLHSWEHLMLLSLGLAGLLAVAIFITTASVVILQRRENAQTTKEYEKYKLTVDAKVADAKREGLEAGQKAGNALVRAAALEKEAQALKAANLALEAQMQPRRVSGENAMKLKNALSTIQALPIGIVSRLLDSEGTDFADDISQVFANAGWQPVRQKNWTMSNKGVALATFEGTSIPSDLARGLLAALDTAGIKSTVTTIKPDEQNTASPGFQPGVLYLLVGAKP